MSAPVAFCVHGIPAPKGSTKAFPVRRRNGRMGAAVTEANPHTRPWVAAVQWAVAARLTGVVPFPRGPVALSINFALPRPKSLPRRVTDHCKKPDLDKLVRAIKDALTGLVWTDDAQVVILACRKRYCVDEELPHAQINVEAVEGIWA
jgi:crossover junction endodeoxyribonuclease RusA